MTDLFVRKAPCKFCGDKEPTIMRDGPDNYAVFCVGCGACGPWKRGLVDAIEAWNRRPDEAK